MSHKLAQQKPESSLPVLPLETESPSRIASNKEVITTIEVLRELDRVVEDSAVLEFEAKRNTANQGKTLETFLALAKAKSQETFNNLRAMTRELELVILQEHGITLQQFMDSMSRHVVATDDITNDIKTLRQAYYDYLGNIGRHCTTCNDDGKTENLRLSKLQQQKGNNVKIWSKCNQ